MVGKVVAKAKYHEKQEKHNFFGGKINISWEKYLGMIKKALKLVVNLATTFENQQNSRVFLDTFM